MVHVLPSSPINISFNPRSVIVTQKNNFLTRRSVFQNLRLFPRLRIGDGVQSRLKSHLVSATGTDVAVEEAEKDAIEALETPSNASDTIEESSVTSNRPRAVRKSEMPPVKYEELIPGATFTGKVRSIQPFGAFVDFGAFTDGLVHVSRLSDSFVKDVNSVVSIGQEVKVKLVEANLETKRISLTMRESDDSSDISRTLRESTGRPNRRNDQINNISKFVKGQELQGTVKNLTRSGAFISLPEGDEGFLPTSEEDDEGFGNMTGISSLQVGQEVNVRVLRTNRGKVTLTMKKEEDGAGSDSAMSHGVVHTATNPFALAFQSKRE